VKDLSCQRRKIYSLWAESSGFFKKLHTTLYPGGIRSHDSSLLGSRRRRSHWTTPPRLNQYLPTYILHNWTLPIRAELDMFHVPCMYICDNQCHQCMYTYDANAGKNTPIYTCDANAGKNAPMYMMVPVQSIKRLSR
jgi:hypothetical protein